MLAHNLPHTEAAFIGRVNELAETSHQLNDSSCRLLTLVGPGGIGKTRLAIRTAENCGDQFEDGVYFVPLQPLVSSEYLCSAIADALHFSFSPGLDPQQQLFQYLREKALLLVLDNFEHLLEGAELLTELLYAAPDIKLLVTSREVLNLQEEWRYAVGGLDYPETNDVERPGTYSAVQLFVARARQVRGDLSLAREQAAIIHVCQLVEGMPLALELAAVWTKALRPDEIASEIQRNLDFLSTSLRNVPQRHQSIQVVFEQTWQRLSEEEQRVFCALSVFRGGFHREAAQAVAAMSLRVLSDLVDKSLLTREPEGRYQIHELLRQFAEARSESTSDERLHTHDLHAAYYARFLEERNNDLNGGRQREAALEIKVDLDNIRAAWSWAVEYSRVEAIAQAAHPLYMFFILQSRFLEGFDAFEKAVQRLDNGDPQTEIVLAKALCALGVMYLNRGANDQGQAALERSWQLYVQHATLPAPGQGWDPRVPLGITKVAIGNFSAAETLGQDAFQDHTLWEDRWNLALACYLLTTLTRAQGKYEEARQYAQQGYTLTQASSDEYWGTYFLQVWGMASELMGDFGEAKRHIQGSYAIQKDIGHLKGMADALNSLGRIALLEGDFAEARRCYEQAWTLYHGLGNKQDLARSLEGMGNSARALGQHGEARRYLREALQNTRDGRWLVPLIYTGIGELFLQTGRQARGMELLALTLHHPAIDYETKARALLLLNHPTTTDMAQPTATNVDFDAVTTTLLTELEMPENSPLTRHSPDADETLIEPLSERELDVLTLIAAGRSNREIADQLFLTVGTVKWYLTHI